MGAPEYQVRSGSGSSERGNEPPLARQALGALPLRMCGATQRILLREGAVYGCDPE